MKYKLTVHQKPTYLHIVVTGQNSRENAEAYIDDMIRECEARKCSKVLIEERLVGPRLKTLDVFQVVAEGSRKARGILNTVAYVDVNAEGDLMHFAETVAVNRMVPMAVFKTVAEARKWLLSKDRRGAAANTAKDKDKQHR
jgi:hypothetical protein